MKKVSGSLTYANIVSTICLFLLLGSGAALAAQIVLPKNSVGAKQLKKAAVTPSKLSIAAKKTLVGGGQGPQGPQGLRGPQGEKGEKGPRGEQGAPGTLLSALPSGQTEQGAYGFASTRFDMSGNAYTPATEVSYPTPLSFKPAVEIIKSGAPPTANCPGEAENPTAEPGFLCVYGQREDVELDLENQPAEGRFGFLLFFEAPEGENYEDYGTWAVTAP
jgi:hypothetical protein